MNNKYRGQSWEEVQNELFTKEEIEASKKRIRFQRKFRQVVKDRCSLLTRKARHRAGVLNIKTTYVSKN